MCLTLLPLFKSKNRYAYTNEEVQGQQSIDGPTHAGRSNSGTVMEVIRHAELIVEWFLWTIEHTNRSLDNSNAFELSSDLLVCSIVQRNHSTINSGTVVLSEMALDPLLRQ